MGSRTVPFTGAHRTGVRERLPGLLEGWDGKGIVTLAFLLNSGHVQMCVYISGVMAVYYLHIHISLIYMDVYLSISLLAVFIYVLEFLLIYLWLFLVNFSKPDSAVFETTLLLLAADFAHS